MMYYRPLTVHMGASSSPSTDTTRSSPSSASSSSPPLSPTIPVVLRKPLSNPTDFRCLEDYRADLLTKIDQTPKMANIDVYVFCDYMEKIVEKAKDHLIKQQIIDAYEVMLKMRYYILAYSTQDAFIKEKKFRNRVILSENYLEKVEYVVDHQFYPV